MSLAWLIPQGRNDYSNTNSILHLLYSSFWYSCPMFSLYQSIPSFFHVSSLVRQPWYIKDSPPHNHQSSPEEDSSLSWNIEIKATSLSMVKSVYYGTRTSRSDNGHASYFKEAPHMLAPHNWSSTSLLLASRASPALCSMLGNASHSAPTHQLYLIPHLLMCTMQTFGTCIPSCILWVCDS